MKLRYSLKFGQLLLALALISPMAHADNFRIYKSPDGEGVKASFQGLSKGIVTLRREDGKMFDMPLDLLSAEDQQYVKQLGERLASESAALNQAAGKDIFTQETFDLMDAESLAQRLKLKQESQSKFGKSWRLYASFVKGYRLFGAMPYSVALYSDEQGKATSISIVYANKGDFASTAGFAEDHFKGGVSEEEGSLQAAMDQDDQTVSDAISSILGKGAEERYGEGNTRRKIVRWDWNGNAILLSNEPGEYVSLSIISSDTADAGGKSTRIKDSDLKARLLASIAREKNGDVYLTQIPMVDQGPKGYCVPATFERAMRTMGIDADMYLLAMVGGSSAGGGTSVEKLLENVRSQVYRKGRRPKDEHVKNLKIRDVKRYIDEGIPVMWTLCSVKDYNKVANEDTQARVAVKDWQTYAATIAETAKTVAKQDKPSEAYHICMIVGYNEATNELAVSDSWGPSYERRWVPVGVADWASNGGLFMILP
ncbi:hypothetical protein JIN85_12235 [Luteolibacter pohnpeiensis]|uniref:Peptidase C39-like domain-containing protein n=1 Tax=Luteolibacter pohnpeiensis TaxID=454153 RepID=A0A934SDE1_9BACT|nr:hypothetical protein [Luteolibacter pohnpeiensis]MBK1883188.1 hypothetical protein [Luteolibacter pohnpeiensis]